MVVLPLHLTVTLHLLTPFCFLEGLLLAETHREDIRYRKAEVVTTGESVIAVNSKDEIYYDRHAGFGVEINKEQYKVIKEQDVVIIL